MSKMTFALVALLATTASVRADGGTWANRSADLQNTGNAGMQPELTEASVKDLKVVRVWQPDKADGTFDGAAINATPALVDGLLVIGDWMGRLYVIDTRRGSANPQDDVLLRIETASKGNLRGRGKFGPIHEGVDGDDPLVDKYTGLGHLSPESDDELPEGLPWAPAGEEFGNYSGVQSTATIGRVTTPEGEELRAYVPGIASNATSGGLYCINLSKVIADRATLKRDPGDAYLCGPTGTWPRTMVSPGGGTTTVNSSPKLSVDQPFDANGDGTVAPGEVLDVIYTPSAGLDCSDGRMWAMHAYTGQILWDYDPTPGKTGGSIWTTPALSRDRTKVFITTGDCVGNPQIGSKAESLIALDAFTGKELWHHIRRLVDAADLDIGTGPAVADVDSAPGCHVVVSSDKDGCVYAFNQEVDIPEIGDPGADPLRSAAVADAVDAVGQSWQRRSPQQGRIGQDGWDPLRMGQQRVLWKKCFVPGTLNGGFNASNGAISGRTFMQHATGYPGGHNGADDSNAFAMDVCTGKLLWASSDISNGRTDAAVASDMLFQIGSYRLVGDHTYYRFVREVDVVAVHPGVGRVPALLATVLLPSQPTLGGGGLAIADGKLYVPMIGGVAEVAVVPGSGASPPRKEGLNIFAGPYPEPIAPGADTSMPVVNPDDPYPLMLENPNPSAFVDSIQGYLKTLQEDYVP